VSAAPVDAPPPRMAAPPLAGWWSRALAWFLDLVITAVVVALPLVPLVIVLAVTLSEEDLEQALDIVIVPIVLLAGLVYFPLTMRRPGARNGQTWGKQLTRIRVVRLDGAPVDANTAVLREVLCKSVIFWTLSVCALFIPTIVNYLWALFDQRNQALHDKMANTLVVRAYPPVQ